MGYNLQMMFQIGKILVDVCKKYKFSTQVKINI